MPQGPEPTKLSEKNEIRFRAWARRNKINDVDDPRSFYDYRGYWQQTNGAPHRQGAHFPDTYKLPGHPTFSVESKYYVPGETPAGRWEGENFIPPDNVPSVPAARADAAAMRNPVRQKQPNLTHEQLAQRVHEQNIDELNSHMSLRTRLLGGALGLGRAFNLGQLAKDVFHEFTPTAIRERRNNPEYQRFLRERPGTVTPEQLAQVGSDVGNLGRYIGHKILQRDPETLGGALAFVAPQGAEMALERMPWVKASRLRALAEGRLARERAIPTPDLPSEMDVPTYRRRGLEQPLPRSGFNEVTPGQFQDALTAFAAKRPNEQGFLTWRTPQQMTEEGMRLYMNPERTTGYGLHPASGDIRNLFNFGQKGAGSNALADAISRGGNILDAFDTRLTNIYRDMGFGETGRMPWNDQYRPANWNEAQYGRPDVVNMEFQGASRDPADLMRQYVARRRVREAAVAPRANPSTPDPNMPAPYVNMRGQWLRPGPEINLPPGAPSVLGASPGHGFVDPGTYHGTLSEGFEVPTQGRHGVHTGTREQAANIMQTKHGDPWADPRDIPGSRLLRLLPSSPSNPVRIPYDPMGWDPHNLVAALTKGADLRHLSPVFGRGGEVAREIGHTPVFSMPEAEQLTQRMQDVYPYDEARQLQHVFNNLHARGFGGLTYPNMVEGEGQSHVWFDPQNLQPWSEAAATKGLTIPLDEQRTIALDAGHLWKPGMSREQFINELAGSNEQLGNTIRHQPGFGEAIANAVEPHRAFLNNLADYDHVSGLAAKADPRYRQWYRTWKPTMDQYFPGEPGDLLTRFSFLSAQKSPKAEAQQMLRALREFNEIMSDNPAGRVGDAERADALQQLSSGNADPGIAKELRRHVGEFIARKIGTTRPRGEALVDAFTGSPYIKEGLKTSGYELAKRGYSQTGALDRHIIRAYTGKDKISPPQYQLLQARIARDAERAGMSFDEWQAMVWGGQSGYPAGFGAPGATVEDWLGYWLSRPEFADMLERFPSARGMARPLPPK